MNHWSENPLTRRSSTERIMQCSRVVSKMSCSVWGELKPRAAIEGGQRPMTCSQGEAWPTSCAETVHLSTVNFRVIRMSNITISDRRGQQRERSSRHQRDLPGTDEDSLKRKMVHYKRQRQNTSHNLTLTDMRV